MAVYKRDIVDINLETGNIHRSFLKHSIGYKDAAADHFGIRVFRNGEPVSLTGVSVQGIFMPPQGDPIAITSGNIVSENEAEVVLPQACYNYDGQFTLSIKLVDATNAVTGTMRIVDGMVDNTHASGTVAPTDTVPSYQEILAVYAQLLEDVTDYESVVATQDAKIDDLKSALDSTDHLISAVKKITNWEQGMFEPSSGSTYASSSLIRSPSYYGYKDGDTIAKTNSGYEFAVMAYTTAQVYVGELKTDGTFKKVSGNRQYLSEFNLCAYPNYTFRFFMRKEGTTLQPSDGVNFILYNSSIDDMQRLISAVEDTALQKESITPIELNLYVYNGVLDNLGNNYWMYAIPIKENGMYEIKADKNSIYYFSNSISSGSTVYTGGDVLTEYKPIINADGYKYLLTRKSNPSNQYTIDIRQRKLNNDEPLAEAIHESREIELTIIQAAFYDGKISDIGSNYKMYICPIKLDAIYRITANDYTQYAFLNNNALGSTAYEKQGISVGETLVKNVDGYLYLAISHKINGRDIDCSVTEFADEKYTVKDLTEYQGFKESTCVVANPSDADYGKTYSGSTFSAYNATDFIDVSLFDQITISVCGTDSNSINFGVVFYDEDKLPVNGYRYSQQAEKKNYERTYTIKPAWKYVRYTVRSNYETYGSPVFYATYKQSNIVDKVYAIKNTYGHINSVRVAAYNATIYEKMLADYVCDGVNDEVEIQKALDGFTDTAWGNVYLSSGEFKIDSFTLADEQYIAVRVHKRTDIRQRKRIIGNERGGGSETLINITSTALTALGENDGVVFGASTYIYGRSMSYNNFRLKMADNQHSVIVIDESGIAAGILQDLSLSAVEDDIRNTDSTPMPNEGCIGIVGFDGDDSGTLNEMNRVFVTGFYEGYRLGGEHLVCKNLGARFNYYSYTFGNYSWHGGTQSHPITLINCCDEHSACLPKFARNGEYNQQDQKAMQQIDFIGFNMEIIKPSNFGEGVVAPAEEVIPGSFCGRIEFTGYGSSNVPGKANTGYLNNPNIQFWADGSGECFETKNMVHPKKGTTAQRDLFTPTFMQQYYDTTLNKMIVYDGTAWVDMNGNNVN